MWRYHLHERVHILVRTRVTGIDIQYPQYTGMPGRLRPPRFMCKLIDMYFLKLHAGMTGKRT